MPPLGSANVSPKGLEPGDVLMYCPVAPTPRQSAIVVAQEAMQRGGDRAHVCFTHLAIYIGNDEVVDASPQTNIARRSIVDAIGGGHVRARRLRGITPTMQQDVCRVASQQRGNYAFLQAVVDTLLHGAPPHWMNALKKLNTALPTQPRSNFYCSSLVEFVYASTVHISVLGPGIAAPMPFVFSADPQFDELPIYW